MDMLGTSSLTPSSRPKNYYELLQVEPHVSRVQIREAFLRLKKTYSSGNNALYSIIDEDEARRTLAQIEEAFRILDDDHLRREYDRFLLKIQSDVERQGGTGAEKLKQWRSHEELLAQESVDAASNMSRRAPTICKVSPRMTDALKQKIKEFIPTADGGSGLTFKQIREMAGVDIPELYAHTKINPEYVQALENNDFSRLPQLVYIKGFLSSYLRFVGVPDGKQLVDAFSERYQEWENAKKQAIV